MQTRRTPATDGRSPRRRVQGARVLRSLRHRNFRFLLVSALAWSIGTWSQRLAASWLILKLTDSPLMVTLTFGLYFIPNLLLGPLGGTVADTVNRKRLLVAIQVLNVAASFLLALIVLTGVAQAWSVMVVVVMFGIGMSFAMPTTLALAYDVVGPADAQNGIALQSVTMRFVGSVGAILGGILIVTVGLGETFLAAAAFYAVGLATLSFMHYVPVDRPAQKQSVVAGLVDGLRYILHVRSLVAMLGMVMVAEAFGYGALALLPLFADEGVLGVGADGLGVMNAAVGFGAMIGAMTLASSSELKNKGKWVLAAFLCYGIFIGGFSQSNMFWLSVVMLAGFGVVSGAFDTMQIILMQQHVPKEMRGRAMGAWAFSIGAGPGGSIFLGYLTEHIGPQQATGISGIIVFSVALFVALAVPQVRTLD